MDIRPIRNDDDHRAALVEIDRLWGADDGTPDGDKLDVLATLEVYEAKRWPIDRPTPRDMLEYAVTDMGRSQKELSDLLGSRSLASELLAGKKRISLDVAQKISAAWKMPIQLLVAAYELGRRPAAAAAAAASAPARSVDQIVDKLPAKRRAKAAAVGDNLIADEAARKLKPARSRR